MDVSEFTLTSLFLFDFLLEIGELNVALPSFLLFSQGHGSIWTWAKSCCIRGGSPGRGARLLPNTQGGH